METKAVLTNTPWKRDVSVCLIGLQHRLTPVIVHFIATVHGCCRETVLYRFDEIFHQHNSFIYRTHGSTYLLLTGWWHWATVWQLWSLLRLLFWGTWQELHLYLQNKSKESKQRHQQWEVWGQMCEEEEKKKDLNWSSLSKRLFPLFDMMSSGPLQYI